MTEEQRRFKIQKRTSYEEQMSTETKDAILNTFLTGLFAAGMVLTALQTNLNIDVQPLSQIVGGSLLTTLNGIVSAQRLKFVIEAISRKTMLQGKIEDINTELEMPENEESRGMRR